MPFLEESESAPVRHALQHWREWHRRLQRLVAEAECYTTEAFLISLVELRFGMREADLRVARALLELTRFLRRTE